ncbi:MAG: phenylalanine--tRNA ligase subunit alpha [Acidobacteria bacterium]|nr:MAG: phenylalanine--tRNA ligase subunit alpha [Acidobacteriota bacterium]
MATVEHLSPLWDAFRKELAEVSTDEALTDLRDKYLSRSRGAVTVELKKLGQLSAEERPQAGKLLNELKLLVEQALAEKAGEIREKQKSARYQAERVDVTLPGYAYHTAGRHPIRRALEEMERIFVSMGFSIMSGPEVEVDYYNFEALNMPKGHPARDAQDTLYVTDNLVLRTHTSPVQIRTMEKQKPPVRIIAPGRVFRRDSVDATHSPMFHQIEGLVVDEGITLADLKGTIEMFLKAFFSEDTRIRLRPSYFPFVEPGAEVDVSCIFCRGTGCSICKQSGWIEIMGAGMVNPRVFQILGYDYEKYTGFAWGMGVDRIVMLKYQVEDLRLLFDNDIRFLSQF